MKNLTAACLIVLALALPCFARLTPVSLEEAIQNSDLIVVGILREVTQKEEGGTIYGEGKIVVEQYVTGNVKTRGGDKPAPGDRLQLNYIEDFTCVYGAHKRMEGQRVIFLLSFDDNGEIRSEDLRARESLADVQAVLAKGFKPRGVFKIIKIEDKIEPATAAENPDEPPAEISFFAYSFERRSILGGFRAFLALLFSVSLYYLLYRSRFRIR